MVLPPHHHLLWTPPKPRLTPREVSLPDCDIAWVGRRCRRCFACRPGFVETFGIKTMYDRVLTRARVGVNTRTGAEVMMAQAG